MTMLSQHRSHCVGLSVLSLSLGAGGQDLFYVWLALGDLVGSILRKGYNYVVQTGLELTIHLPQPF